MAVGSGRGRARLRLGLLVLTAVVLMTLDFRGYPPLRAAQSGVLDLIQPIVSIVETGLKPVQGAWTATLGYRGLQSTNTELQAEVDRLKGDQIRVDAYREAYRRLREATDIDYIDDIERITASVLRDTTGNFRDDVILIDKGRRDGLVSGMAVVNGAGFVGSVEAVGVSHSTVTTVSSPSMVVSVRLLDTDDVGLGHGMAGDHDLFVVDTGLAWPEAYDRAGLAATGSAVVTAASSRYPADIPVGRVVQVEPVNAGLVQQVTVELSVDTQNLGFVTVLLAEPQDQPPSGPDSPFTDTSSTEQNSPSDAAVTGEP